MRRGGWQDSWWAEAPRELGRSREAAAAGPAAPRAALAATSCKHGAVGHSGQVSTIHGLRARAPSAAGAGRRHASGYERLCKRPLRWRFATPGQLRRNPETHRNVAAEDAGAAAARGSVHERVATQRRSVQLQLLLEALLEAPQHLQSTRAGRMSKALAQRATSKISGRDKAAARHAPGCCFALELGGTWSEISEMARGAAPRAGMSPRRRRSLSIRSRLEGSRRPT